MFCNDIFVICSEIHTTYKNIFCTQNVEFLNVKPGVK